MDYDGRFVMQKTVDWSLLNDGMTIPTAVCSLFAAWDESILKHGMSKDVKILISGELYDAKLKNQNFVQSKWEGHKDVIQIRYGRLPDDIHEYIRLYLTASSDVLCIECCADAEYQQLASTLSAVPEEIYEASGDDRLFLQDKTSSIEIREQLVKYRKIDRGIIRQLKEFYDYRDEISGERIGSEYGDSVVEAHHIDYFTRSQNNDSTNIIIISPNYHRIIHRNNPRFNRRKFQFEFPNGEVLKLKLYEHLKMG